MSAIDADRLAALWDAADRAETAHDKGRALEELVAWLFGQIPGLSVTARNAVTTAGDQEIDVAFWNDQAGDGLRQFDAIILVECKNWNSAVGAAEVSWFLNKLRDRGRPFGILVAAQGITGDAAALTRAQQVVSSALSESRELVVLTRAELEGLVDTDELVVLLKKKRAWLAVTGGAL